MTTKWDEELGQRMQSEQGALTKLTQILKEHIAAMPVGNTVKWLDGLRAAYERFNAHIRRTIEIKEEDGYLETILRERPTLVKQVGAIKSENDQIVRLADAIRVELAAVRPEDRLILNDICARIERFAIVVGQHEQRENMIVLFAFNQDLGGD